MADLKKLFRHSRSESRSRLGGGELSTPEIAQGYARVAFFGAIERTAGDVLIELRDTVLPLYFDVLQSISATRPGADSEDPEGLVPGARCLDKYSKEYVCPIFFWERLKEFHEETPHLKALHDGLDAWSKRYGLTDEWFMEELFWNFSRWDPAPWPDGAPWWEYTDLLWVMVDTEPIFKWVPPAYNPFQKTRIQYTTEINKYCEYQERLGYRTLSGVVNSKKLRNSEHYDWLVQFQVLGWNYTKIALRASGNSLSKAITAAVKEKAKIMGLTLRPAKRGRPRTQKG